MDINSINMFVRNIWTTYMKQSKNLVFILELCHSYILCHIYICIIYLLPNLESKQDYHVFLIFLTVPPRASTIFTGWNTPFLGSGIFYHGVEHTVPRVRDFLSKRTTQESVRFIPKTRLLVWPVTCYVSRVTWNVSPFSVQNRY